MLSSQSSLTCVNHRMIIDYCRKYFITNKVIGFEKQELLIVAGKFLLESTRLSVCLAIIISKQIFSGNLKL